MAYAGYILATLLARNAIAVSNGELWWGQVSNGELALIHSFDDAIQAEGVSMMVQSEGDHYLVGIRDR